MWNLQFCICSRTLSVRHTYYLISPFSHVLPTYFFCTTWPQYLHSFLRNPVFCHITMSHVSKWSRFLMLKTKRNQNQLFQMWCWYFTAEFSSVTDKHSPPLVHHSNVARWRMVKLPFWIVSYCAYKASRKLGEENGTQALLHAVKQLYVWLKTTLSWNINTPAGTCLVLSPYCFTGSHDGPGGSQQLNQSRREGADSFMTR